MEEQALIIPSSQWVLQGSATCTNAAWKIAPDFSSDRLYLDAVHNMDGHEAVFQASVIVV